MWTAKKQTNNVQYPIFEEVTLPTHKYLQIGPYSQNFEFIVYLKVLEGKITFHEKRFWDFKWYFQLNIGSLGFQ